MISWIQKNFQQHFRIVFALILVVVVIAFVFTIGSTPGIGDGQRSVKPRPFFGINLASAKDGEKINRRAQLSGMLNREQTEPLARVAKLALADQLHLPEPTDAELMEHVKTLPMFKRQAGEFDAQAYNEFRTQHLKMFGTDEAEIRAVMSEDFRIARVEKLLGGPGYVLPAEIKRRLAAADTTWTLSVATVDDVSFNPPIKPTEAELTEYFEKGGYDIPPQVRVSYVEFPAHAFVNAVMVSEPEVRAHYDRNPAAFPKPANAAQTPKTGQGPLLNPTSDPSADYALVRPQVEAALKLERAKDLAAKAATELTVAIDQKGFETQSPAVDAFLASRQITLKDMPAFSRDKVSAPFQNNPQIATEAFKLNQNRFFSDAIPTDQGAAVLFWRESIPSRAPALAEVREKVLADFVANEKKKRFVELGRTIQTQLAARVKTGEAFEKAVAAVAASSNVNIEAKTFPAFTRRQRPQDLDYSVDYKLETLNAGEVSEMIVSPDNKGRIVHAQDKKLPDVTEANPQFVTTYKQFSEGISQLTAHELVQDMVQAELKKTAPEVAR